ncbi:hypothetical protein GCM10007981_06150 [Thermocladium modestius]|uniref:Uncharacterized protein n=1 Tax=Thermocladium modestius TaxID=62609 RepID=A0A830GVH6_9CREN|nr:hypothetical protein [Thermocladium modestius]GGP20000.1 hypothetical protein GCM10007981_06150 [Thermocladium modestius]
MKIKGLTKLLTLLLLLLLMVRSAGRGGLTDALKRGEGEVRRALGEEGEPFSNQSQAILDETNGKPSP